MSVTFATPHWVRLTCGRTGTAVTQALGTRVGNAVTRALVGLATDLDLTTVIEGIETPAQAGAARALGCTHAQGFLWSPAVPADEVRDHLTTIPAGAALH